MITPHRPTAARNKAKKGACDRLPLPALLFLSALTLPAQATPPVTTYEYDPLGHRTWVVDPLLRPTQHSYDARGRLTQTTDPTGGIVQYQHDALDRLVAVTDPRQLVTSYQYNAFGDLLSQSSPDTGLTQNTYDPAGNLLTRTDAKGQTTSWIYDAINRPTRITYADGQITNLSYDQGTNGIGRRTGLTHTYPTGHPFAGVLTLAFTYDARGRVLSETRTLPSGQSATLAYQYDTGGRLSQLSYPSGRKIAWQYDAAGRISAVLTGIGTADQLVASQFTYRPFGPEASHAWGNLQPHPRSYDPEGRLVAYPQGSSQTLLGYDAASRITYKTDSADASQTHSYSYDNLDRLSGQVEPTTTRSWTHDPVGNRLQQTAGGGSTDYQYGASSNRQTQAGSRTITTDAVGAITSDGQRQFTYDARGRMTSSTSSAGTTHYLIDPLGRRLQKQGPQGSTAFLYDLDGHLIAELDAQGSPKQEHLWANGAPLAVVVSGVGQKGLHYVHTDHLGTPRVVMSQAQQVLWRWDGEAFGSSPANEDVDGDLQALSYQLRFPGQYFDQETGLHYNFFRDYDPGTGRYVESDPIGLRGGINTYAYVGGNPISWFDSQGLNGEQAVQNSQSQINSGDWSYRVFAPNLPWYQSWRWKNEFKCNLFVYQMLGDDAPKGGIPSAAAWASKDPRRIPGYRLIDPKADGIRAGDIASDGIHMGIVEVPGVSTISQSSKTDSVQRADWGFRPAQIENGSVVYRRCECDMNNGK